MGQTYFVCLDVCWIMSRSLIFTGNGIKSYHLTSWSRYPFDDIHALPGRHFSRPHATACTACVCRAWNNMTTSVRSCKPYRRPNFMQVSVSSSKAIVMSSSRSCKRSVIDPWYLVVVAGIVCTDLIRSINNPTITRTEFPFLTFACAHVRSWERRKLFPD